MFTKKFRKLTIAAMLVLSTFLLGGAGQLWAFSVDVKNLYYYDPSGPREISYDFSSGTVGDGTPTGIPVNNIGIPADFILQKNSADLAFMFGNIPDIGVATVTLTGTPQVGRITTTEGAAILQGSSAPPPAAQPPAPATSWTYSLALQNFSGITDQTKEYKFEIGCSAPTTLLNPTGPGPQPQIRGMWSASGALILQARIFDDAGNGTVLWSGNVADVVSGLTPTQIAATTLELKIVNNPSTNPGNVIFSYRLNGGAETTLGTYAITGGLVFNSLPARFPYLDMREETSGGGEETDPFQVYSSHSQWNENYGVSAFVYDPGTTTTRLYTAVYAESVGIASGNPGYLAKTLLTHNNPSWSLDPTLVHIGTGPPAPSILPIYRFTATPRAGGDDVVKDRTISSYVADFVNVTSPVYSGSSFTPTSVAAAPTFIWTWPGVTQPSWYNVYVSDWSDGNRMVWSLPTNNLPSSQTSQPYLGPLVNGDTYQYTIMAGDVGGNSSARQGYFTYTGASMISFSGWAKTAPNWPAMNGAAALAGTNVSAYSPGMPPTLINTTTPDGSTGAFTLTGIPASSDFYLLMQPPVGPPPGYMPVLSKFMNWNDNIQALLPFAILTQPQYAIFNNGPGNGMILGRVALKDNPTTFLAGATIEAQEWTAGNPPVLGATYAVTYTSGSSTGADGIYMVKGVPTGKIVQLVATLNGHTFEFNGAVVPVATGTISEESFYATPISSCTYSLNPTSAGVPAEGTASPGSVTVTAGNGCAWMAVSNASGWLHVTAPGIGTGNGSFAYTVDANSGIARTGTITTGGQTFTVNQQGVAAVTNLLQNGDFSSGLNNWIVNPSLQIGTPPWTPLQGDGTVALHPSTVDFLGTILYQNLNIADVAGNTVNMSMKLTKIAAPEWATYTIGAYLTYVDANGGFQRVQVTLLPANSGIASGTTVTGSVTIPAGAQKIIKIEITKDNNGSFTADDIVLSGSGMTAGTTPNITSATLSGSAYPYTLTISGTGFGAVQGFISIGGSRRGITITSWTTTSIQATLDYPASSGTVIVNAGAVESNIDKFIAHTSPYIAFDPGDSTFKAIKGQKVEVINNVQLYNGLTIPAGGMTFNVEDAALNAAATFIPAPFQGPGGLVLKIDTANLAAGTYTSYIRDSQNRRVARFSLQVVTVQDIIFYEYDYSQSPAVRHDLTSKAVSNQGTIGVYYEVKDSDNQIFTGESGVSLQAGSPVLSVYKRFWGYAIYAVANGDTNLTATAPDGTTRSLPVTMSIPGGAQLVSSIGLNPGTIPNNYTGNLFFSAAGNNAALGWIGNEQEGMPNFETNFYDDRIVRAGNGATATFNLTSTPSDLGTVLFYAQSGDGSAKAVVPLDVVNDPTTGLLNCMVRSIGTVGFVDTVVLAFFDESGNFRFTRKASAMHMGNNPIPVGNIPPGSYRILFIPQNTSAKPQWWPNATTFADAKTVGPFTAGGTVEGIYFFTNAQPAGATVTLPTASQSFNLPGAASGSISVTATAGAVWAAMSNDPWITVTSGVNGSGNGTVNFSVAANPSPGPRTGTLTVGGQTFTVTQAGVGTAHPIVGTWGVSSLQYDNVNLIWYTESSKLIFGADGTGSITGMMNDGVNQAGQRIKPINQTFSYTIAPTTDGSYALALDITGDEVANRRVVLSNNGTMAVMDGTADPNWEKITSMVKLDTGKNYSNADLNGDYYSLGYESNMSDVSNPPNGNGSFMAISSIHNFSGTTDGQGLGTYTYNGLANSTYTGAAWGSSLYSDGSNEVWPDNQSSVNRNYRVTDDGSMTAGNGAFLGGISGNGKVFGGNASYVSDNWVSYFFMKKGDKSAPGYSKTDLAGKWAVAGFGDDKKAGETQSFGANFGTMTCDSAGACSYKFRDRRSSDSSSNINTGSVQLDVAADGSFGAYLVDSATNPKPPAYAGAIGNDGNTVMFNISFDPAKPWHREVFVGVKAENLGDLAGGAAPTITFSGTLKTTNDVPINGGVVAMVDDPEINTTTATDGTGSFALSGLPSGTDFSLIFTKPAGDLTDYVATYTSSQKSTNNIAPVRPFNLFTSTELNAWRNSGSGSTGGVIRGRVSTSSAIDPQYVGYISNAVVTYTSAMERTDYAVMYEDSSNVLAYRSEGTYANGRFYILNVAEGDVVTVYASQANYTFPQAGTRFITHAGAVSTGSIPGAPVSGRAELGGTVKKGDNTTAIKSAIIKQMGASAPTNLTVSNEDGNYFMTVPSGTPFYVEITKPQADTTYAPTYSPMMNITGNGRYDLNLYPLNKLTDPTSSGGWGLLAERGIIRGKVKDHSNNNLENATVTATSTLGNNYVIKYCQDDGTTCRTTSTYTNGSFMVMNVVDTDTATVTAFKTGYALPSKIFHIHASSVHQGGPTATAENGVYSLNLSSADVTVGGTGAANSVNVTAGTGFGWTAESLIGWIHITGGATGNGNGTVNYTVDANTDGYSRMGTIAIAGQNFTVNQAGAGQHFPRNQVTTGTALDDTPAWSPLGQKIAFTSNRAGNYDIWVVNTDGTGLVQLTTSGFDEQYPAWNPDGTKLAYILRYPGPNPAESSFDGYFLYTMDADGSNKTLRPLPPAAGRDQADQFWYSEVRHTVWLDATHIAFVSYGPDGGNNKLYRYDLGNNTVAEITPAGEANPMGDIAKLSWSGAANLLAYDRWPIGIQTFTPGASNLQVVNIPRVDQMDTPAMAGWNPSGMKLAYVKNLYGNSDIGIYDLSGGTAIVDSTSTTDRWPVWSPDGSKIAIVSDSHIWILNVGLVLKGDLNDDKVVNLADAILALQVIAGMQPAGIRTDYLWSGSDVNGNGKISLEDLVYILQHVAGLRN